MLLQGVVKVSSQKNFISVSSQIKIWSLASVSRAISTLSRISYASHFHYLVESTLMKTSLTSLQSHHHGLHSSQCHH